MSSNISSTRFTRTACAIALVMVLCTSALWAQSFQDLRPGTAQALVLEVGRSVILRFDDMKRVAIVHTEIADVSVPSSNELIVVADPEGLGKTGNTMLYVWDKRGLHKFAVTVVGTTPAERVAMELAKVLGPNLNARPMSRTMVVIDGEVNDDVALENLKALAEASSTDEVKVVSMATAADAGSMSPASRAANALSSILDPRLKVTAWGDDVVVIEGEMPTAGDALLARGAMTAFAEDLKLIDMITVAGQSLASQAPVAQIQKLLGDDFRVSQLSGNLVAVDGVVEDEAGLGRIDNLLAAFAADGVQTINMVQVIPPMPDLAIAQSTLQAALGDQIAVKLIGDEALMLEGAVPDEARMEQVNQVLTLLGDRVPVLNLLNIVTPDKQRVLVGVKVVELNLGARDNLGIDWGQYSAGDGGAAFRSQPFLYGEINGRGSGMHKLYNFGAQLHALIQDQHAQLLSEPNLLVNDGEEASILIGGEIPIPVASDAAGGFAAITIEYKSYGVDLTIKPTINPDGTKIVLEVSPEVSSLDYGNGVTISGLNIPGMRTRRAQTIVTIEDGGLLAIGGLIANDQSKAVDKIPLLSELPFIGKLFQHETFINNRSELVIFVIPQILDENGQPVHPIPVPEGYPEKFQLGRVSDAG